MSFPFPICYYHPTTWVLVDDHEIFLRNLSSQIPHSQEVLTYDQPHEALNKINSANRRYRHALDSLRLGSSEGDEAVYNFSLRKIEALIEETAKHEVCSLVVVDYLMPQMNGLQFLDRLEDPSPKKILLTGVADQQLAIEAFNAGKIDRFYMKGRLNELEGLFDVASNLEMEFLRGVQSFLSGFGGQKYPDYVCERVEESLLSSVRRGDCLEFYRDRADLSFLCVDKHGNYERLLVANSDDFQAAADVLRQRAASEHVVEQVQKRKYFFDVGELADNTEGDEMALGALSQKIQSIPDAEGWYLVHIENPSLDARSIY